MEVASGVGSTHHQLCSLLAAPYLTPLESVTFIMLLLLLPARHKRMAWAVNKLTGIKEKKLGV